MHRNILKSLRRVLIAALASIFTLSLQAQQGATITGMVTDENGAPMPGANVVVKGDTRGVTTDKDGNYVFPGIKPSDVLEFSFIGYQTQSFAVEDKREINVAMLPMANELDEVTVVAFGKQKKASVIASVESVKTSDLKIPSANMTSAFAGKIPGIISYQTSGEPGADNAQFFVRGVTTFGYKQNPLILIDGFEATTDDLARLQPDDVESFSILKDASATVLYGARGANGIILVNTKSGREGSLKVSARVDVNVATPTQIPKMVGAVDYMRMYNEAQLSRTPALGTFYSEQKIQSTLNGENPMIYPNVNWYEMLFNKSTINTKANLNVSGGGKVATYYVAGGYDNETGLLKVDKQNNFSNNINIDRFHLRSNVIFKLTESTTLDTRINGRFEKYNGPYVSAGDIFASVMNSNPVDFPAVFTPDEALKYVKWTLFGSTAVGGTPKPNPYATMVSGFETRDESTITAQATLMQDLDFITEGLKIQAKASANTWSKYSQRRSYSPYYYDVESYNQITGIYKLYNLNPQSASATLGGITPGRDATVHYYFEGRVNWDRVFGKHSVGAMVVGMAEENLLTGGNSQSVFESLPERNSGLSGRATYNYGERYFFEFAFGYNGSEKFTGAKKFGFFPSVGFAWIVSNEGFWAGSKDIISNLKLKFTWGKVGNDAIAGRADRFWFLSDINLEGNGFIWGEDLMNSYSGYKTVRYANPDISWEVSQKFNLGVELGLLKNEMLKLQIDIFKDYRDRIYIPRDNIPATGGLEAPMSGNSGKVESQGIDASLDVQHNFNDHFWMTGRANLTYAVNKFVRLDERNYPDKYLSRVGYNINQQWGYVAERLFVDRNEINNSPHQDFGEYIAGDIKYSDVNQDGTINSNDRIAMGYPTVPEIQYGFGLSMGYKKFDFSFFFQGNAHVSMFINARGGNGIAPLDGRRNALQIVADSYWTENNPDVHAFWPRLSTYILENNVQQSSWWMRDASFLRLKTIEFGYNVEGIKTIHLQNIRIYGSVENAFVLSPFKLWDPEMGASGLGYPLNRRFNLGIQLNF